MILNKGTKKEGNVMRTQSEFRDNDTTLLRTESNAATKNPQHIKDKEDTYNELIQLHQRTTYIPEFDRMKQSVFPFLDYFGLCHFYYVKILPSGDYCTLGTYSEFHEFTFDHIEMFDSYPVVRHPDSLKSGVFIEINNSNEKYIDCINYFINKFKMTLTLRIQKRTNENFEFFGFGTKFLKRRVNEALFNEISLVNKFIDYFKSENKKLIQIAFENKVNMIPLVGSHFYEREEWLLDLPKKIELLRHMGLETGECLTDREKEILQYMTNGYPARYIAGKLYISVRTVENYIAEMKSKLNCVSKVDLINVAKNLSL